MSKSLGDIHTCQSGRHLTVKTQERSLCPLRFRRHRRLCCCCCCDCWSWCHVTAWSNQIGRHVAFAFDIDRSTAFTWISMFKKNLLRFLGNLEFDRWGSSNWDGGSFHSHEYNWQHLCCPFVKRHLRCFPRYRTAVSSHRRYLLPMDRYTCPRAI